MVSLSAYLMDVLKFIMSSTLHGELATSLKSFAFSTPLAVPMYASLDVPARPKNTPSFHSLSSFPAPDFLRGSRHKLLAKVDN